MSTSHPLFTLPRMGGRNAPSQTRHIYLTRCAHQVMMTLPAEPPVEENNQDRNLNNAMVLALRLIHLVSNDKLSVETDSSLQPFPSPSAPAFSHLSALQLNMGAPGAPDATTDFYRKDGQGSFNDMSFPPSRTFTLETVTAQKTSLFWLESPEGAPFSSIPMCCDRHMAVKESHASQSGTPCGSPGCPWLVDRRRRRGETLLSISASVRHAW